MKFLVLAIGFAAIAGCASSATENSSAIVPTAPAAASSQEVAQADGSERICRRMEVIGSIRPQRVCATQSEWDAKEEQEREGVDSFDRARRRGEAVGTFE